MADLVNTTGGIIRLNTHNYQSWRSRIKSYLEGQDLWEVVNGNDTKPPKNAEKLRIWKVKAAKAMYVLKSTIEDWLLGRIRDDDTPNMAWDIFASLFSKTTDARLQYGGGEVLGMDTELYKAAKEGNEKYLQAEILRRDGKDEVDSEDGNDEVFLGRTQHGNNNILHIAARAGRDIFVVEALRHFPVLSDQVNSQGDTPLLVAARFGHLKVVETLMATAVENRANVEEGLVDHQLHGVVINWEQGTTALHEALRNGHEDVARYLLGVDPKMATIDSRAGESPLFLAAESRCELFMSDVLLSKWLYSTEGPQGLNPLHAARDCCGPIIALLIQENPDLMRQLDIHGKAAIHHAVEAEYWVLMDEMLVADSLIALFPDADGYTPLLRAASRGCWKLCEYILKKCPESIEARDHKGRNALHLCSIMNYGSRFVKIPEIWGLLNVADNEGNTPLHVAVIENHYEKAMLLTSSVSIDLGAVNKGGLTALDLCESDWMHLNKKRLMWFHLRRYGAPRGRRPNEEKVPVEGPKMVIRSPDEDTKPYINTMSVVAALIATLTFAAAFTMPGGYDSSGEANLVKKAALKAFILSDALAMCCSITVVSLLWKAMRVEQDLKFVLTNASVILLHIALLATLVAFMSGVFAVIAPKALWLAILVCIVCSTVFRLLTPERIQRSSLSTWFMPTIITRDIVRFIRLKQQRDKRKRDQHDVLSLIQRGSLATTSCVSNTNTVDERHMNEGSMVMSRKNDLSASLQAFDFRADLCSSA